MTKTRRAKIKNNQTKKNSADLYRINLNGKNPRPLTRGPYGAMNVEAAVSPDGRKVAFSSDRSGKPMVYVMDINGKNIRKLTNAGRYNSTPSWSPDGKHLTFASLDRAKGAFDVMRISINGMKLERLTSARKKNGRWANNEDPAYSPDGRHILFVSDRTGRKQLYLVNPDGTNERRITHDSANYEKPKWSPYTN